MTVFWFLVLIWIILVALPRLDWETRDVIGGIIGLAAIVSLALHLIGLV